MEGVHPAHRDKFRMQSMLGTAIQSHETRKCAEHRDSRGKVGLTHSEAVAMHTDAVKRLDEVPTLCVSIQEKILLTQTLLHDIDGNKRALSQHSGLVGLIHLLGHFVLRTVHSYWRWTVELSTKSGLWRTRIKEIEGRHGSSSGVYFRALKWVFVMTVFQAIIWASMIFIPFGVCVFPTLSMSTTICKLTKPLNATAFLAGMRTKFWFRPTRPRKTFQATIISLEYSQGVDS